jgi:hypothetical protein
MSCSSGYRCVTFFVFTAVTLLSLTPIPFMVGDRYKKTK